MLKVSPIARCFMEMFGPMPIDGLHEIEFDPDVLLFRSQLIMLNESSAKASLYKSLEISSRCVKHAKGYWGMYLN